MLIDAPWPQTVVAYAIALFLYSIVWTYNIKTVHRCVLELNSGFFLILTAYNSWLYLIVFILYTVVDIFVQNTVIHRAAGHGLVYFYAHTAVALTASPAPFLSVLPVVLIVGRLYRLSSDKKSEYVVYDIRSPPVLFQFLV